jgi:hypothetical protein
VRGSLVGASLQWEPVFSVGASLQWEPVFSESEFSGVSLGKQLNQDSAGVMCQVRGGDASTGLCAVERLALLLL